MISLPRTPKIWPVMSLAWSVARNVATGAMWAGDSCLIFSTRAFCASVSVGIVPIIRVQAKGEMQFAVTLRSEEHTSELQSQSNLVCRLLLEKKKKQSNRGRLLHGSHESHMCSVRDVAS